MAPLAVHPAGGFAPGPGCCDASSRNDSVADVG